MKVKQLVRLASVASIYVLFTIIILPLSYGPFQFRISEILVLLVFFRKDYGYAIIVGCFISNLFSPLGYYDLIFGVAQTVITVFLISKSNNLFMSALYPVLSMPIIAYELYLLDVFPLWFGILTTMAGEFAITVLIGYPVFKTLRKNKSFLELIDANRNLEVNNEI